MNLYDDEFYKRDERGLTGFDKSALEFVDHFMEELISNARIFRLTGQDVMHLHQARQVMLDFRKVDYDGYLLIRSSRADSFGNRYSEMEIQPERIVIGVSGSDPLERGGESYSDAYFIIGAGQESDTLEDDLASWEEEFMEKLTHPDSKLTIEGEINDIRETEWTDVNEEDEPDQLDDLNG